MVDDAHDGDAPVEQADYEIEVLNDTEHSKYEAWLNQNAVAELTYQFAGNRIVLMHAEVDPSFQKHKIATELVEWALNDVRASGRKATIICPVVRGFIDKHPEFEDVIDSRHPGVSSEDARAAIPADRRDA